MTTTYASQHHRSPHGTRQTAEGTRAMGVLTAMPFAPTPRSPLGRYRLLSPTSSVGVSPLCLGTMHFGDSWKGVMECCDQRTAEDVLDFFFEQGGNFIDTSNNYQWEGSETWIGDWMSKRGVREQMVIATKYSTNYMGRVPQSTHIMANFTGNGSKNLVTSVKASLHKLRTDYIDLLYVHWWDYSTSIPELMQSLNNLVVSGKVLYLGVSNTPAWAVSKANEYARNHGLRQFSVYQGCWSAASRDFEREIIPMAQAEGMALVPWGALGGGAFKTEEQRQSQSAPKVEISEAHIQISRALERISKRKGTIITSVALAYVMHKCPYVFPVVGGQTVHHLRQSIEALSLELTDEELREIEAAAPFDMGFPHNLLWGRGGLPAQPNDLWLLKMGGHFDFVPLPKSITPAQVGE
ncbi:aldo/keto reductase [Sodiomyces alkalinus F11]|uniref:Aldo/keto reductase n=1 Tax=Sodiomyces alkalinus (strain CBS 110278 / VKM F-3762 / F11) TaxID=1314773 RepID=A0A3N2PY95_SODAK|nr:aldo/keto reductase [Sodiomyces alkalinus F11]ROT39418.1 aldo/keto reductase [Sodiomyces alkalinus F11]